MPTSAHISFVATEDPSAEPTTRFGGQPDWLSEPQWPLSRSTQAPMEFIGQIALDSRLFSNGDGKIAYVFMTRDVDNSWDPEQGESAIIIQPSDGEVPVETDALKTGPSVATSHLYHGPIANGQFGVRFTLTEEPDFVAEDARYELTDEESDQLWETLNAQKIGGTPLFIQGDEFPTGSDEWQLLFQLEDNTLPFAVNFGTGIGYAFVDKDCRIGRLLWQC